MAKIQPPDGFKGIHLLPLDERISSWVYRLDIACLLVIGLMSFMKPRRPQFTSKLNNIRTTIAGEKFGWDSILFYLTHVGMALALAFGLFLMGWILFNRYLTGN